ncbi:MAG: primosomal protein N' [Kiritimatiellae bacterium]|nr:primosomal protein N' [Kiritimatiellia bacterium]
MLARLCIENAPADRLFDYEVPEELARSVSVGSRVRAPFARRMARGFVVEFPEKSDYAGRLARIAGVEEPSPMILPPLVALARWMSRYYMAPLGKCLETILPAPVRTGNVREKKMLYVAAAPSGRGAEPCALTSRQAQLLADIGRVGGGWLGQVCREFKCSVETLKRLEALGALTIEEKQARRDPLRRGRILPSRPLPLNAEQAAALAEIVAALPEGQGPVPLAMQGGWGREPPATTTSFAAHHGQGPVPMAMQGGGGREPPATTTSFVRPGPVPAGRGGPGARSPRLLFGVTGSGKTEVYLQAIAAALERGLGAIVLVPEISLTPQTVQRFASRFGASIAVLHSALSNGERFDEWQRIRRGEARVVVGPRSAIFAPVRRLGLIVVDEEHEPSYKQEEAPRYNARDAAVMRAHIEGCAVVLGSATPALESWNNARAGKYRLLRLPRRAAEGAAMPLVHIVDMRLENAREGRACVFSKELLNAIGERLERSEQVMVFLNRRGYSTSLSCEKCGHVATCPRCDIPFTYHRADDCLRCHVCGAWERVPAACPDCGDPGIRYAGVGTQRVEQILRRCFPRANIARMDADSTSRKESHDDILDAFKAGRTDILVGTQMIAKGLHFPRVTLVGIVNADTSLNVPDFRAGERTFQLLAQVSGRTGRGVMPGEVYVQTFSPEHPAVMMARTEDYAGFVDTELPERQALGYPPFTHLTCVTVAGPDERLAQRLAQRLRSATSAAAASVGGGVEISEACPAILAKADGIFRFQIVLRAPSALKTNAILGAALAAVPAEPPFRIGVDVDAFNF